MIEYLDRKRKHRKSRLVLLYKHNRFKNIFYLLAMVSATLLYVISCSNLRFLVLKTFMLVMIYMGININSSYSGFIKDDIKKKNIDELESMRF